MQPKPIKQPETQYEGKIFSIQTQKVEYEDGETATYELCYRSPSVNVFAFNEEGQLLLIKEERFRYSEPTWFLPAGKIEQDETPEEAAQKELQEEAGYKANQLELYKKNEDSSYFVWDVYFYIAKNLEESSIEEDKGEMVEEVKFFNLEKAAEMAIKGDIKNEFLSYYILKYSILEENITIN
ncbi:MAG: NUDIX hydrolase [Candidatus Magasanikbacteria bacterium]